MSASSTARPHRHARFVWLVAALLVGLAAVATWQVVARHSMGQVSVRPLGMECDGKDVPLTVPDDEDRTPVPTFDFGVHLDTVCTLRLSYVNSGSRAVHVDSALFPMLMPGDGSAMVVELTSADGGRDPQPESDGSDALFPVDETIDPDTWIGRSYTLRYRQPTSTCSGGTSGFTDLPVVKLSVMGVHRDVTGVVALDVRSRAPEGHTRCG